MDDIDTIVARLEGLMAKATPTEGEFRHEPTDYVFQRYSVRGVPCGFPVAIFGDDADASFFVGVKDALPILIAHIRALSGAVEAYDSRLRIEMWNALRRNGCTQDDALAAIEKEMSAIRSTPIVPAMTEDKAGKEGADG